MNMKHLVSRNGQFDWGRFWIFLRDMAIALIIVAAMAWYFAGQVQP